jgi:hypothetical protein
LWQLYCSLTPPPCSCRAPSGPPPSTDAASSVGRHRAEASSMFPSSVSFTPAFLFRFWLGPNTRIPPLAVGPHRSHCQPPTASSTTEHPQAAPTPLPPHHATPRVSSSPDHLACRLRPSTLVPHRQTSPCLSGLAAAGNHATAGAPHTVTTADAFAPRPHNQAGLGRVAVRPGRFDGWPRPTVPDRAGCHAPPHCGRGPNVNPGTVRWF